MLVPHACGRPVLGLPVVQSWEYTPRTGGGDGGKIHRKTSWGPTFPGAQPGKDLKRKLQGSPKQSFEGVVVRKIFDVERLSDLLFPLRFVPSLVHSFVQILSLIC